MTFSQSQSTDILRGFGFRIRTTGEYVQCIRTFQGAYNLGSWLACDGVNGPATSAALSRSQASGKKASAHFSWSELKCGCGGRFDNCRRILIARGQLRALEVYRAKVGHPVHVISAYRCPQHNKEVGGASNSMHMYGLATDVNDGVSNSTVAGLRVFTGIGRDRVSGRVEHVDTRAGASTSNPILWTYS